MFGVTILGNNSALPAFNRHPTSQVVTLDEQLFLIDCGEATQTQLSRYKVRRSRINHIFISHLHGDHYFGLPGLITSFGLLGRTNELHVYSPAPLQPIINLMLKAADTVLPFDLHFHGLMEEDIILNEEKFSVECFKVNHRIECYGFIIREKKKPRRINREQVLKYDIPATFYERLKSGEDHTTKNGELIKNELLTVANTPAKSYAFCADTGYNKAIAEKVKNVSLLYHETTYLKNLEGRAESRFHSTTTQAAQIAKLANAKQLIIGHFSSKYESLSEFLEETREVFENTALALEGATYLV